MVETVVWLQWSPAHLTSAFSCWVKATGKLISFCFSFTSDLLSVEMSLWLKRLQMTTEKNPDFVFCTTFWFKYCFCWWNRKKKFIVKGWNHKWRLSSVGFVPEGIPLMLYWGRVLHCSNIITSNWVYLGKKSCSHDFRLVCHWELRWAFCWLSARPNLHITLRRSGRPW